LGRFGRGLVGFGFRVRSWASGGEMGTKVPNDKLRHRPFILLRSLFDEGVNLPVIRGKGKGDGLRFPHRDILGWHFGSPLLVRLQPLLRLPVTRRIWRFRREIPVVFRIIATYVTETFNLRIRVVIDILSVPIITTMNAGVKSTAIAPQQRKHAKS
jgi:hypothetical protein